MKQKPIMVYIFELLLSAMTGMGAIFIYILLGINIWLSIFIALIVSASMGTMFKIIDYMIDQNEMLLKENETNNNKRRKLPRRSNKTH